MGNHSHRGKEKKMKTVLTRTVVEAIAQSVEGENVVLVSRTTTERIEVRSPATTATDATDVPVLSATTPEVIDLTCEDGVWARR